MWSRRRTGTCGARGWKRCTRTTAIGCIESSRVSASSCFRRGSSMEFFQCPCCDYFTLDERGGYDICPVCFWEDDGQDIDRPDEHSGPNHMTLREGRDNFRRLGACDPAMLPH